MQRRQFIMLGLAAGSSLALGTALIPLFNTTEAEQQDQTVLVLDALLPALLLGALPPDAQKKQQALLRSREAVLAFLPFLPVRQQQELQQLFRLLNSQLTRLALSGHWVSLNELPVSVRLELLKSWRDSYLEVLQQAYHGLKELLLGAYYGQPEHWHALSYQAPEFNPYV